MWPFTLLPMLYHVISVDIPHFKNSFISWWTFGLFLTFGYYEYGYEENLCTNFCVDTCFQIPWVYTKEWNCWVIVIPCLTFRELSDSFPKFRSVQSLSHVWLFATPWTAARQASLSITNCRSLPKPMSIESVMPSNHLILCCPLLLLPSIFPSIRVFSNESTLHIRWPNYWSFIFNISPSSEHPGLICFRMDCTILQLQWDILTFLNGWKEMKRRRLFHETWKFYEIHISASINKVLLEHSYSHSLMH